MSDRPTPEKFLQLIRAQSRGRLKVYLGFAPGVGKTCEMLQEGHRLKSQGVDVVIGVVETHGRAATEALISDLERIPCRRIDYRGVSLHEMDLAAILVRKPSVVLVDELAHTNAPGSKNPKRYQDVEELLRAGIHVITTLNIQHLESLYDVIERFAGVKVKERVPDHVLAGADQIVNVDLPAEDLQERLRQGLVYPPERIERAIGHFFKSANLNQLRELALEELANLLDRRRRSETNVPGSDRIMVCVSSGGPNVLRMLRKAARLADRFHAPWYAVYVKTPRERNEKIDAATQRRVSDALDLARQLGGVAMPFNGANFESAVSAFVTEYGITQVLVGRSRLPWYRRWFGRSPLDRLLQAVPNVDVVVLH